MKKIPMLLCVLMFSIYLTGCNMIAPDEAVFEKYCEQFPTDEGCIDDGVPTGILDTVVESCSDGYILQDNVCVVFVEDPDETVSCDSGYHEVDGLCVLNQTDEVCQDDLILYNGDCLNSCEVPIDNLNYYPCFRECNDEFLCTYHKLVLAEENSYFESFVMWVKMTDMNNSSEFELHYILKGETEVIISDGGINLWCRPQLNGCEDLYKAKFAISNTTGDIRYIFEFWYDESWYTEVTRIWHDVWNTETAEYDDVNLDILVFYLEDIGGTD